MKRQVNYFLLSVIVTTIIGCNKSNDANNDITIDSDNDGISDNLDSCPNTPKGLATDKDGCSLSQLDTDFDTVSDLIDECPNTRNNVPVNEVGCMINPIFLDENGTTIKCHDWAIVGDSGSINDKIYYIIDEDDLQKKIERGEDVTNICTSKISDMSWLFYNNKSFNQNISSWDVSNVENMSQMFFGTPFNFDIRLWDVRRVKDMSYMFSYTSDFNQEINQWEVDSVTTMLRMFSHAQAFNKSLDSWNVVNVIDMYQMFYETPQFNQDIGSWDVSKVEGMGYMFYGSLTFNQDISTWNVINVEDMSSMFMNSKMFNQDLSNWNVDNVVFCEWFSKNTPQWTLPKPSFMNCDEEI